MIRALLLATVPLVLCVGCTIPIPVVTSRTCHAESAIGYVGQRHSERIGRIVKDKTQAAFVRVLTPETVVTQEFRAGRVNIAIDDKNLVTRIYCG